MSLIVEDGTAKPDAEAYNSFASATAYHLKMGNVGWTAVQVDGEAALRRAQAYMARYRPRWAGFRLTTTQALDWPRQLVAMKDSPFTTGYYLATTIVPPAVLNGEAEFALLALTDELEPDLTRGIARETIGPITTEYDKASPEQRRYPRLEALLQPFFSGGSNNMRIRRG